MLRTAFLARRPQLAAVIGRRGYAAAAAAEAVDAEIPKSVDTAGRYSSALFNAASRAGTLEQVTKDVAEMQDMQLKNEAFGEFMRNPSLPRSAKVEALGEIAKRSGFSDTFSQFMLVLAENGRTAESVKIYKAFQDIIASLKGEVVVKVTSTVPLSDWELALLKKNIKKRFFDGKQSELTIETAIDEELLGGLTIQIGDRFMDLSTRTELRKLQELITKAI